jgi:hypothetical protein
MNSVEAIGNGRQSSNDEIERNWEEYKHYKNAL